MPFYINEATEMLAAEIPPGTRQFGARLMYLKFKLEVDASAQIADVDTALKAIMDGPTQVFPNGFTTTEAAFLTQLQNRPNHFSEAFRILMRAATYQSLFDWASGEGLVGPGLLFGPGDGSTTFTLPDLRGRGFMGYDAAQTEFNAIGKMGGAKTHTLSIGEMPVHAHTGGAHTHSTPNHQHNIAPHSHEVADHQHGITNEGSEFEHSHSVSDASVAGPPNPSDGNIQTALTDPAGGQTTTGTGLTTDNDGGGSTGAGGEVATSSVGGGAAHNILQPYFVGNWLIKT